MPPAEYFVARFMAEKHTKRSINHAFWREDDTLTPMCGRYYARRARRMAVDVPPVGCAQSDLLGCLKCLRLVSMSPLELLAKAAR